MSKHPENELWCQNHDQPISIDSLEEWEEAKAAGHLTFEHVINRLRAMLEYQFGRAGVAGFDEVTRHGSAHQSQSDKSEFCHKTDCTHAVY